MINEDEIAQEMVDFHEAFVEALDEFIVQSVEIAENEFDLEPSDAFSMMASRMMFIVIRGVIKGGTSKEVFLNTLGVVYEVTELALSEPEGTIQ